MNAENMYDAWDNGDRHEIRKQFAKREKERMTDRELMQQALEILEDYVGEYGPHEKDSGAAYVITALRERLAQPEQEPVATVESKTGNPDILMSWWHEPALPVGTKLYTAPLRREWVGLTGEEVADLTLAYAGYPVRLTEAIEAKLKEKNA